MNNRKQNFLLEIETLHRVKKMRPRVYPMKTYVEGKKLEEQIFLKKNHVIFSCFGQPKDSSSSAKSFFIQRLRMFIFFKSFTDGKENKGLRSKKTPFFPKRMFSAFVSFLDTFATKKV